ncbi:MAG: hypothetical protein HYX44_07880, partial [Aquabacterium sp.]|nr:hypothetical protein [Aquabacterium sp.]
HLGALDGPAVVIMLGRSNVKKRSASIDSLLCELHARGLPVCWYERRGAYHARLRAAALARMEGEWLGALSARHPSIGRLVTKGARLALKLRYPKRRYGLLAKWRVDTDAHEDFRLFLRLLPAQQVFIVSHSAGGLVASLAESEPAVHRMICFGYPFKHPDQPEDGLRTAHLAAIRKPFLIIQGDRDEYGGSEAITRYTLSPQITVRHIDADHDYDLLGKPSMEKARQLMLDFLMPHRALVGSMSGKTAVREDDQE